MEAEQAVDAEQRNALSLLRSAETARENANEALEHLKAAVAAARGAREAWETASDAFGEEWGD